VDSSNKPIENAYVEAVLTNHAFGFGTAITRRAMYDSNYTKFIKDHFNWAVLKMNPNGIQMNPVWEL